MDDRRTFERGPFVLLLIATLFLLVSNVASARTRPPVVGAYTAVGSASLFVGNVLLFPDMPSHVVTSWWLGATLFYTLGLHIEKGDLFPGRRERLLPYVLIGLALIGAVLKTMRWAQSLAIPTALHLSCAGEAIGCLASSCAQPPFGS